MPEEIDSYMFGVGWSISYGYEDWLSENYVSIFTNFGNSKANMTNYATLNDYPIEEIIENPGKIYENLSIK